MALSETLAGLTDEELLARARDLRWQAKSGTVLQQLLPDSYALVREAARRTLGQQHYLVQIVGGIGLFEGGLAEMQTGEGKTLTATLPTFLRALPGRGCHVVTVNDYLAERDCELMGPVYERLGLTVGSVLSAHAPESPQRRTAYNQDITYATAREIGFDFLRDRLKVGAKLDEPYRPRLFAGASASDDGPVQRGHYFALIDEADSVLIDDAVTPLIIGLNKETSAAREALLNWSRDMVPRLQVGDHFFFESANRNVELTIGGEHTVFLAAKPSLLARFDNEELLSHVEQALRAQRGFQRGRDYIITPKDEIGIIDEGTGRTLEGRKWQDGLHQAIEAKERVPITAETGEAARITVQTFFRRYEHLAGMTGTALSAAREFRKTYRLGVTTIPTHRRCIRMELKPRMFATQQAKQEALVPEIERLHQAGRPLLIGTPSVAASEALGEVLRKRGLNCQILNALNDELEAQIVAAAGQPGSITIATNMAGRGTDIILGGNPTSLAWDELKQEQDGEGRPMYRTQRDVPKSVWDVRVQQIKQREAITEKGRQVAEGGGLHVIATEMHSSRRIDRQLVGRAARQGDPGSYQFWLSLEDELFRCLEPKEVKALRARSKPAVVRGGELPANWLREFRRTQRIVEARERKHRKQLLLQEKSHRKMCQMTGLDPFLDSAG